MTYIFETILRHQLTNNLSVQSVLAGSSALWVLVRRTSLAKLRQETWSPCCEEYSAMPESTWSSLGA